MPATCRTNSSDSEPFSARVTACDDSRKPFAETLIVWLPASSDTENSPFGSDTAESSDALPSRTAVMRAADIGARVGSRILPCTARRLWAVAGPSDRDSTPERTVTTNLEAVVCFPAMLLSPSLLKPMAGAPRMGKDRQPSGCRFPKAARCASPKGQPGGLVCVGLSSANSTPRRRPPPPLAARSNPGWLNSAPGRAFSICGWLRDLQPILKN